MTQGDAPQSVRSRLIEIAAVFIKLGFTSFGGPAVHTALMEEEVVQRRQWLDRQHFLDLVAALNFIPGPNSTELAIHLGYIRAGWKGLLVAGASFIVPAVLIILPLAWAYVSYGSVPQIREAFVGINAVVVAILIVASIRFAKTAIRDAFTLILAIVAGAVAWLGTGQTVIQIELVILALAAILGAMWYTRSSTSVPLTLNIFCGAALPASASAFSAKGLGVMFLEFLKIGATLFGSGYVLVSYLRTSMVEQHQWLSDTQLVDAIAVGQITPGPLLTTATFVGYLLGQRWLGTTFGGIACGVIATAGIFLPSFIFVALFARMLPKLRSNRYARGALDAMNAAVVALIVVVTIQLGVQSLWEKAPMRPNWFAMGTFGIALAAMLRWNINPTWIIVAAGVVGGMKTLV